MTPFRVLGPDDFVTMPWKNGLGTTVEIAKETAPDGVVLWRVSMAEITADGAFSLFPGVDRVLTLIEGPEFILHVDGQLSPSMVGHLSPVYFSGDLATKVSQVTGISRDFNVMTSRERAVSRVKVLRKTTSLIPDVDRCLLFCLEGTLHMNVGGSTRLVHAGEIAIIANSLPDLRRLSLDGTAIRVDIDFLP